MTRMHVAGDEAGWLRSIATLRAEPAGSQLDDPLAYGQRLGQRLAELARTLAGEAGLAADCACDGQVCLFAGVVGGRKACRLALDLARRAPGDSRLDTASPPVLAARYLAALRTAAGATYFCRRVMHGRNQCWFSVHGPADDLCARVLAAGHSLATISERSVRY